MKSKNILAPGSGWTIGCNPPPVKIRRPFNENVKRWALVEYNIKGSRMKEYAAVKSSDIPKWEKMIDGDRVEQMRIVCYIAATDINGRVKRALGMWTALCGGHVVDLTTPKI